MDASEKGAVFTKVGIYVVKLVSMTFGNAASMFSTREIFDKLCCSYERSRSSMIPRRKSFVEHLHNQSPNLRYEEEGNRQAEKPILLPTSTYVGIYLDVVNLQQ